MMMVLPSIYFLFLRLSTTFVVVPATAAAAAASANNHDGFVRQPSFLSSRRRTSPIDPDVLLLPRGGASSLSSNNDMVVEVDPVLERRKNYLKDISLALRWTGEMNRQLHEGTTSCTMTATDEQNDDGEGAKTSPALSASYDYGLRGGGGDCDAITSAAAASSSSSSAAAAAAYRIRDAPSSRISMETGVPLTPFHAKSPRLNTKSTARRGKRRVGAARYGPDLHKYLEHLVDVLGVSSSSRINEYDNANMPDGDSDESLILTLAMIYLDRACSVETPRSVEGAVPCPFVTPRTVHRLLLCAMVVAVQTVRGETLESMSSALQSLGIPYEQLQQMISWFYTALGDPGLFVAPDQMQHWKQTWETCFPPAESSPSQQHDEPVQLNDVTVDTTAATSSTGYYEVEEVVETEDEEYYQEQQQQSYYDGQRTHHHAVGVRAS